MQIPKAKKKTDDLTIFFALLGFACVKAAHKMVVKSTPGPFPSSLMLLKGKKGRFKFLWSGFMKRGSEKKVKSRDGWKWDNPMVIIFCYIFCLHLSI